VKLKKYLPDNYGNFIPIIIIFSLIAIPIIVIDTFNKFNPEPEQTIKNCNISGVLSCKSFVQQNNQTEALLELSYHGLKPINNFSINTTSGSVKQSYLSGSDTTLNYGESLFIYLKDFDTKIITFVFNSSYFDFIQNISIGE